jgi:hypothetical protein
VIIVVPSSYPWPIPSHGFGRARGAEVRRRLAHLKRRPLRHLPVITVAKNTKRHHSGQLFSPSHDSSFVHHLSEEVEPKASMTPEPSSSQIRSARRHDRPRTKHEERQAHHLDDYTMDDNGICHSWQPIEPVKEAFDIRLKKSLFSSPLFYVSWFPSVHRRQLALQNRTQDPFIISLNCST